MNFVQVVCGVSKIAESFLAKIVVWILHVAAIDQVRHG